MTIRVRIWRFSTSVIVLAIGVSTAPVLADEMRAYVKHGGIYEEVKLDLEAAIEGKGIKIGFVGDLGEMLARTQSDLGKSRPIYKSAHYFQFCSAALSHKLIAADPKNIGHCPFLMFAYEELLKPNEIVVGYRTFIRAGSDETRSVLNEADALLDAIARESIQ